MTSSDRTPPVPAESFGEFISQAAREAGYDIDAQRGGGRAALARHTGMSASSVGRMLAGKTLPSPRYFEPLARALGLSLRRVMIEAGVVTEESLAAAVSAPGGPLTPRRAAELLGITKSANVELFVTMVENMQEQERGPKGKISRGAA